MILFIKIQQHSKQAKTMQVLLNPLLFLNQMIWVGTKLLIQASIKTQINQEEIAEDELDLELVI